MKNPFKGAWDGSKKVAKKIAFWIAFVPSAIISGCTIIASIILNAIISLVKAVVNFFTAILIAPGMYLFIGGFRNLKSAKALGESIGASLLERYRQQDMHDLEGAMREAANRAATLDFFAPIPNPA